MIIETALVELAKAGGTELFLSSSESLLKKVKTAKDIKQLFINTGEFFVDYENDADQLFDDMANVLSKENMTKLANELKDGLEDFIESNSMLYWQYAMKDTTAEFESKVNELRLKVLPLIQKAQKSAMTTEEKILLKSYVKERFGISL